jgi:2,3-bisphosphoglycerate-independent phosphoglycerate mutase
VLRDKTVEGKLTPPHDISKMPVRDYLPKDTEILALMEKSHEFFKAHPYNAKRREKGEPPVSSLWIWGEGKKASIGSFYDRHSLSGAVISAVDLIKGIGILAGLGSIDVPGATGTVRTNYEGKVAAAIGALKNGADFLYLHIEAADEAGHHFDLDEKIRAVEYLDSRVFAPLAEYLENCGEEFAVLVTPDHPTPVETGSHSRDAVPFFAYYSGNEFKGGNYNEDNAKKSGLFIEEGHALLGKFIKKELL